MKASDLFIRSLEKEGVRYIFGIPGEENLDFLESLNESNIKLILTRHEQAAGFMAATHGRLTGKVGVCLSTLGPGATNLVTAAAYAQLGAMPMLMISGQKQIKNGKQGRFQIINVVEMMRPITKYTNQVVHGNSIPVILREAVRMAEEERPGSAHIELPEDIAAEECSSYPIEVAPSRRPKADQFVIDQAVKMIQSAKSPLLLIGAGANRHRTCKALRDLIDNVGIYFFNTQMGKGVVDERHPLFLGTAALSDQDYLHCAIDRTDLIINVGHDVIEKPPFFMESGGIKVIHINYFPAQVDEVYFPELNVVGDIADSIYRLAEQLEECKNWDFSYFKRIKIELESQLKDRSEETQYPVLPQHLVKQVRRAMPEDGIIALDNGIYKIWFARNYKAYSSNTVILDNALATMGAGFPSAMAAKIVFPEKKVMAICGDGGFMMNSQEIETAVRLKLDLVVLILRDNAFGMIKWKQAEKGFKDFGLDFENPDFVQYAESYGAHGHRLVKTEQLSKLLGNCLHSSGVHLIEMRVDYSENKRVLIDELKAKTCIL
jgi:acetolactate synthase-1/2/3 large subunit